MKKSRISVPRLKKRAESRPIPQAAKKARDVEKSPQKEDLCRLNLDRFPLGIYRTTPSGRIINANTTLANILGYDSVAALKKINVNDTYLRKTARTRLFRDLKKRRADYYELELRRKDGRIIWVRDYPKPIMGANRRILYNDGILVDITERKLAEQALEKSESSLHAFLNAIPGPAMLIDRNSEILLVNEPIAQRLGRSFPELLGRCAFDFIPPEIAAEQKKLVRRVIQTGKAIEFEETRDSRNYLTIISPDLDVNGKVQRLAIVAMDISSRKKVEAELKRRIDFEVLITRISTRFITLPAEKTDAVVKDALEEIGRFAGVDRSYIFQFSPDGARVSNTHEWCSEGIDSQIQNMQDMDVKSIPLAMKKLKDFELLHIPRFAALPPQVKAEMAPFRHHDIQSLIIVPMVLGKSLFGFLGFDSIRQEKIWPEDNIILLKFVGEIFLNALVRKRSDELMRKRTGQVIRHQEALLELVKLDFADLESAERKIAETDAKTLEVDRVGIWAFNDDHAQIICRELYTRSASSHEKGKILQAKDYPRYFMALEQSRVLAVEDVYSDKRTKEFIVGYNESLGITSLMDVPIRVRGKLAGIVCHERTGPKRAWTLEEQQFAVSVGDLISLAMETFERRHTEKVKNSVFRISEAALSSENLEELFQSIQGIVADLMPAKNFYIALFDPEKDLLSFPYFRDEYDDPPPPKKPGKGLTEYVLRTGEPLLASPEVFGGLLKKGEVEAIGAPSIDWLGVPLKIGGNVIGVLVIQSYTEGIRYREEDKNILKFFSDQAAQAIHRKQSERALKASLSEKEVLLREIHHRVKNNMQVISSLLNLQANHVTDAAIIEMFRESQRRIRSMALVHERLYQSADFSHIEFSEYLRSLAVHLFHSYRVDSSLIRLNLDVEKIFISINTAVPLGLIVNELISNALKHAFPERMSGEVSISLRQTGENNFSLRVKDDGVGFREGLDFRRAESLGMQIVMTLISQIEARIERREAQGTDFEIIFKEVEYKAMR